MKAEAEDAMGADVELANSGQRDLEQKAFVKAGGGEDIASVNPLHFADSISCPISMKHS